jgi:hypothetical protein
LTNMGLAEEHAVLLGIEAPFAVAAVVQ